MNTVVNDVKLTKALHHYKTRYLNKKLESLDESSTRIIVNHLLSDVLGYRELVDIKTEYPIVGGYIDYLIEIKNKKKIVVEVKSISTRLSTKHLRQAIYYGAMVGSDWIILTNARHLELYKIKYTKPLRVVKLMSVDLRYLDNSSNSQVAFITKRSLMSGNINRLI